MYHPIHSLNCTNTSNGQVEMLLLHSHVKVQTYTVMMKMFVTFMMTFHMGNKRLLLKICKKQGDEVIALTQVGLNISPFTLNLETWKLDTSLPIL